MNFRIVYADYMQNLPEAAWNCTCKSFKFNQNSADLVLPRLKSRVRIPFPAPLQVKNSKQPSVSAASGSVQRDPFRSFVRILCGSRETR